jgi:transposase
MYVTFVPNRKSPPTPLLRESFRRHGQVKNRTLANLKRWPPEQVEALRQVLQGNLTPAAPLSEAFDITRSQPHGHVVAVLGALQQLGLPELLDRQASPARGRALALVAQQILEPSSKLAAARALHPQTCHHSLGDLLQLGEIDENHLYQAMDWLQARQPQIESALARRHLRDGTLVLYDVTSTYFEGRHCPLAKYGYSRDERRHNPQIVFGVLSNGEGCPVAVQVFEGNVADPKTVASQITKLRQKFQLERVVLVGDRGMLTEKRIQAELRPLEGWDWITALRAPQIQKLVSDGVLQMSLFDERDLAQVRHPDYPGERLVVCRNPLLAAERARKRQELIAAAEKKLDQVVTATQRKRQPLRGAERISYRVGRALATTTVTKYFHWEIREGKLHYQRQQARIDQDAALDGIYVIRTSVGAERLSAADAVRTYKRLATIERAFRSLKSVDLHVRPIRHRVPNRVRAHLLLCLLAYYVEWHMRRALAPLLFDDEHPGEIQKSPVAPAQRSASALRKAHEKKTSEGLPVQSFQDWLRDLATIAKNHVQPKLPSIPAFDVITRPTPSQAHALKLLRVSL